MILRVDPTDPVPAYEQIRAQIARMVAMGTLETGTRLPTIRQLAADLGLAKGTVSKAYESLESDSIVSTNGRHGTVVAASVPASALDRRAELDSASGSFIVAALQVGASLDEAIEALHRNWADEAR